MTAKAVFAGGCFWGMRDLTSKCPGVISTRVGYIGGDGANARYRNHGARTHMIEITFDSEQTSYRELLGFFSTLMTQRSQAFRATTSE
jgi:peptide-methionine (S)-S-oxide reductase